jgi:hypothetical protein
MMPTRQIANVVAIKNNFILVVGNDELFFSGGDL